MNLKGPNQLVSSLKREENKKEIVMVFLDDDLHEHWKNF